MASLTLHSSEPLDSPAVLPLISYYPIPLATPTPAIASSRVPPSKSTSSFRFFDLPAEIRLRIYEEVLVLPDTIDLDPKNVNRIVPRLAIFRVNRQAHEEAYRVFYGSNTFRLFPVHGRFFHTRHPLLSRLPARYRSAMTALELRLGPGWTAPPKCWAVTPRLGLSDLAALRRLNIFIECDPASDAVFAGFRRSESFYTDFCRDLLLQVLLLVPALQVVHFDAWESIKRDSPLLTALVELSRGAGKSLTYGPHRAWSEQFGSLTDMMVDMMRLM